MSFERVSLTQPRSADEPYPEEIAQLWVSVRVHAIFMGFVNFVIKDMELRTANSCGHDCCRIGRGVEIRGSAHVAGTKTAHWT